MEMVKKKCVFDFFLHIIVTDVQQQCVLIMRNDSSSGRCQVCIYKLSKITQNNVSERVRVLHEL